VAKGRPANYRHGMSATKRIHVDQCCSAIIDYQDFFLAQLEPRNRSRLRKNMRNFARLLAHMRIPTIVTLERPVHRKGAVPQDIKPPLGSAAKVFEKDFFDLTKEKPIRAHLKRLKKTQVIVAGCETDVCVLQSCLGLLELGFEVFAVEELLFSSARNVDAALARLRSQGVTILSYKTLYFELIEAVAGGPHAEKMLAAFGEFPDDLPEEAAS
jgi:nicotinamidase-related amidase